MRAKSGNSRLQARKQIHRGSAEEALQKFERYERRLDELEGQVESYGLGGGRDSTLAEEFEALETDDAIDEELEALKQRINESS